jgi:nucleotidyltransferase substrate binding protein, HI0074 family
MLLDLSALSRAIQSLDAALRIVNDQDWFNAQRAEVQQTLLAGVVQNFEFVYELCMKMIRRRLELDATSPTEIDFSSFRDLIRTAAEKGLVVFSPSESSIILLTESGGKGCLNGYTYEQSQQKKRQQFGDWRRPGKSRPG